MFKENYKETNKHRDGFYGSMIGGAVCDALGAPIEFTKPYQGEEDIKDMITGGKKKLSLGEYTDDTAMALCILDSLIKNKGSFDRKDQMDRYIMWFNTGYMGTRDCAFGMGRTVKESCKKYLKNGKFVVGSDNPKKAGNGSIMRLAPVPMMYSTLLLSDVCELSMLSSTTTHQAATCLDACRYMGSLIYGGLHGAEKDDLFGIKKGPFTTLMDDYLKRNPFTTIEIKEIHNGSYTKKNPPEITGYGWVVTTLEAALWAFYKTNSFEEGALKAVNLRLDADTVGAVYGQIAGAYYGLSAIPEKWISNLMKKDMILGMLDEAYDISINLKGKSFIN
ncbi:ADP-ribosylglycohydrolase [Candidatus Magnetobacterium bavaricum]|uniref:ADP-ribosylglycohydrolase n=1 Tax=Candidatus Magnetobacterium bavaricum TaxID=29290 RepID=A0A0F3GX38_9BACT|nr:ADP-ribosylglycohydrolase [Candidatus Magnetobacterium bavaricum]